MTLLKSVLTVAAITASLGAQQASAQLICREIFGSPQLDFKVGTVGELLVSDILVTGHPFEIIKGELLLTDSFLNGLGKSKSVVSIGEGFSELLPNLLSRSIDARGVDLFYHTPQLTRLIENPSSYELQQIKKFYEENRSRLLRGDARHLPIPTGSVDVVLSHKLANNLHIADQLKFFAESIRVLKAGGEARINLLETGVLDSEWTDRESYKSAISSFLKTNYGGAIQHRIVGHLLVIKKKSSIDPGFSPRISFKANLVYKNLPYGNLHAENNISAEERQSGVSVQPVIEWDRTRGIAFE